MIELHDAGIIVHIEDFPQDGLGWRDSPTVAGRRLVVNGNEVARLLQALGLTFDAEGLYSDEFDVVFHRPFRTGEAKPDVLLEDVLRIQELRARTDGPRLLHIHVTSDIGEADSEDQYVQELTYSGSYTVWWSTAEE